MEPKRHFRVYKKTQTQEPIMVIEATDYLDAISIIADKNINPATIHIIEAERDNQINNLQNN